MGSLTSKTPYASSDLELWHFTTNFLRKAGTVIYVNMELLSNMVGNHSVSHRIIIPGYIQYIVITHKGGDILVTIFHGHNDTTKLRKDVNSLFALFGPK